MPGDLLEQARARCNVPAWVPGVHCGFDSVAVCARYWTASHSSNRREFTRRAFGGGMPINVWRSRIALNTRLANMSRATISFSINSYSSVRPAFRSMCEQRRTLERPNSHGITDFAAFMS